MVEVRLTDFGGCRLNTGVGLELANQSWKKDPVQKFRALLGRSLTTGLLGAGNRGLGAGGRGGEGGMATRVVDRGRMQMDRARMLELRLVLA